MPEALQKLMDDWNVMATANGLPKRFNVNPVIPVYQAANKRLKDKDWVAAYPEALKLIPESSFLLGETGWKANFVWFVRPESVQKVLDGQYAGPPKPDGNMHVREDEDAVHI